MIGVLYQVILKAFGKGEFHNFPGAPESSIGRDEEKFFNSNTVLANTFLEFALTEDKLLTFWFFVAQL